MSDALDTLTSAIADEVVAKAGPKLVAYINAHRIAKDPDPLLTVNEAAKRIGLSSSAVRRLVQSGELRRAPGISEIFIKESVVDAYGK